jgi:hypothetical protein
MEENSVVINLLTSMITPAVLILACGSLSLTTSQRLSRSIARTRKISLDIKEIRQGIITVSDEEKEMIHGQLLSSVSRSVLLQRVMTMLYIALSFFIATSLLIGIFEVMSWGKSWILILLPMLGSIALLAASILLIMETRHAIISVNEEMDYRIKSAVDFIQEGNNI